MCYCFIPLYVLVALGGAGAHPTEEKDEQLQREQLEVEFTQNILQNEAQYLRKTLKEDAEYLRQVKEEFPLESLNEALAAVEDAYGRPASEVFASFDTEALAAASMRRSCSSCGTFAIRIGNAMFLRTDMCG